MATIDPSIRLAQAHRDFAEAVARRDAMPSSQPGYHEAVLQVGIRWSQVRYWERRATAAETDQRLGELVAATSR